MCCPGLSGVGAVEEINHRRFVYPVKPRHRIQVPTFPHQKPRYSSSISPCGHRIGGLGKSLRLQERHVDRRCQPAICDLPVSIRVFRRHDNDCSSLQLCQYTIAPSIATAFFLGGESERLQLLDLDEKAKGALQPFLYE
jgi:hypothetical protein